MLTLVMDSGPDDGGVETRVGEGQMWSLSEASYYLGFQGSEDPQLKEWLELFGEYLSEFARPSAEQEPLFTDQDLEALFFIRDEMERQTPIEKVKEMLATGQYLAVKEAEPAPSLEQQLVEQPSGEPLLAEPVEARPEEALEKLLAETPVEMPAEAQPEESLEKLLAEAAVGEVEAPQPVAEKPTLEAEIPQEVTEELALGPGAPSQVLEELKRIGEEVRALRDELETIRQLVGEQEQLRSQREEAIEDKGRLLLQLGYLQAKLEQALGVPSISPPDEVAIAEAVEVSLTEASIEGIIAGPEAAALVGEEIVAAAEEEYEAEVAPPPEEELDPIARLRKKIIQTQEEQAKAPKKKRGPWPFGR